MKRKLITLSELFQLEDISIMETGHVSKNGKMFIPRFYLKNFGEVVNVDDSNPCLISNVDNGINKLELEDRFFAGPVIREEKKRREFSFYLDLGTGNVDFLTDSGEINDHYLTNYTGLFLPNKVNYLKLENTQQLIETDW